MIGTIIDYSVHDSSVHYIKVLSGERVFTITKKELLNDVIIGDDFEFCPNDKDIREGN